MGDAQSGDVSWVDEVAVQFERAWKANPRPRIEDYLADASEPRRTLLLTQLLQDECELRRRAGEEPTPEEYRRRFPRDTAAIDAVFGLETSKAVAARPQGDAGRNLLFGVLALQHNFIGRDDLLAAFAAWVADRAHPLGQILLDRGALDEARRALLEALVAEHLKQHGGDAEASLAAVSSLGSIREGLEQLGDPDLQASLAATAPRSAGSGGDAGATATGASSSRRDGGRFRILRFHREGGLGRVYVARDEELGREVALKQIRPDKVDRDDLRGRFVLEAEINGGLEHPGIVPVYSLGTYEDGRPFYAMRFVEGDSLKEAIESYHKEHPRPDPGAVEFRKLLGRFIDVCDAIAFAHSKGVLHRDLKPHNVMLGRYGETLLIDWGLAKATGRREPSGPEAPVETTLVPPSGSGHAPTLGVLGTPPYMSPEQASGATESLGPATDVYGLGAILFAVLTGKPPVEGKTTEEVLDRVRRGALRSPRSLNPNVPRALEAVCLKALSARPADRYSTARALADDVERWLADEPVSARRDPPLARAGRWVRRHQTLSTTAAALAVFGLLGLAEVYRREARHSADLARVNAELRASGERERARFDLAIEAIETFHTGVSEDLLLKQKEFDALRTKLLRGALGFYAKLAGLLQGQTDPHARLALATAYNEVGMLQVKIGKRAEAMESFKEAAKILEPLVEANPRVIQSGRALATCYSRIGTQLSDIGRLAEALASFERALKIQEGLTSFHPNVTQLKNDRARSHLNIALALSRDGKPVEALASYNQALAIYQDLVSNLPDDIELRRELAICHNDIGALQHETGKHAEALKSYEKALDIEKELATVSPDSIQFQDDIARSHNNIGQLQHETGKRAEALESFKEAAGVLEPLVRAYPGVAEFRSDLVNIYLNTGVFWYFAEEPTQALDWLKRARKIQEELVRDAPEVKEYEETLEKIRTTIELLSMDLVFPTDPFAR